MLTNKSKIGPADPVCLCFRCTTTKSSVAHVERWDYGEGSRPTEYFHFFQVHYAEEIIFELCVFC